MAEIKELAKGQYKGNALRNKKKKQDREGIRKDTGMIRKHSRKI